MILTNARLNPIAPGHQTPSGTRGQTRLMVRATLDRTGDLRRQTVKADKEFVRSER